MSIIRGRIGERSPPFGNKITVGESPFYQHSDGHWYDKKTHKRCKTMTLAELLDEHEKEAECMRRDANKDTK